MKMTQHMHDTLESELCLIGGQDAASLAASVDQVLAFIDRASFPALKDITLTTGLAAAKAPVVTAIVTTSLDDLQAKLRLVRRRLAGSSIRLAERNGIYYRESPLLPGAKLAFVFPGEGSQYPDMLRDVCLHFPACRSAFDDADTACAGSSDAVLPSGWIFPVSRTADTGASRFEASMAGALQSVLAADVGFLRLAARLGIVPDGAAGPGIGEIAALQQAGVLDIESRPRRIQALREGYELMKAQTSRHDIPACACLSVGGLDAAALEACLAPLGAEATLARQTSPDQFALCVTARSAGQAGRLLTEAGAVVRLLPFDRPYHTPWFAAAAPNLRTFFQRWVKNPPRLPVYSCIDGAVLPADPDRIAAQCVEQWMQPVRFVSTIETMYADGYRVFFELGARGTLTSAIDAILHRQPHLAVAANRVHRGGVLQFHHALAALAANGLRFDVTYLHSRRGSRLLDLSRPRSTRQRRPDRSLPLATSLVTFRGAEIPASLVAPAAPAPAGLAATAVEGRAPATTSDGRTDFPLLLDAVLAAEEPGRRMDLLQTVSVLDQPFLADSSLGTNQVSVAERTLRGLTLMPLAMAAEFMAETALRLAPSKVVTAISGLRCHRWFTIEDGYRPVRIEARLMQTSPALSSSLAVHVRILDHQPDELTEKEGLIAEAGLTLDDSYPAAPAVRPLALHAPQSLDWRGQDIYPSRLFHGTLFQNLHRIAQWGENGLVAEVVVLPRSTLLRRTSSPRFALDPVLFGAVGAALAVWHGRELFNGRMQLPMAVRQLRLHAPPLAEWSTCRLNLLRNAVPGAPAVTADAQVVDAEGHLVLDVEGFENCDFALPPALHRLLLVPTEGFFSRVLPAESLPTLPQEVVCCLADQPADGLLQAHGELWLKALAHLTLSLTERLKWREMGGALNRRIEWLLGRVAAKDAVRRCLMLRYGRKWSAADIRIETDDQGKPRPQGEWRRHCGAMMDISITHTGSCVVAAVAPNACLGIDVERRDRAISDEFAEAAFCSCEQELAAETGEGPTALIRFWCAKEALAKALGTGIRYGASDIKVRAFDRQTGRIELELTRLWLQVFPHLKSHALAAHTCLMDNLVLAVSVLPRELVRPEGKLKAEG